MDYIELAGIIIVMATGCIKIIEGIIRQQVEKRVQLEKSKAKSVETGNNLVSNWVQWSHTLEKRINEAEATITGLQEIIQFQKIKLLEMEQQNHALINELKTLKQQRNENRK